ncbi:MAG: hypothetical protein GEU90_22885, partial [Gemmatimonas sp.]|nr:hypothetical protein [Gemmatimonas sp.]
MTTRALIVVAILAASGCAESPQVSGETEAAGQEVPEAAENADGATDFAPMPEEIHFANMQRLTHGGSNSEAYFSADATQVIFQATRTGESECDQIYTMNVDGTDVRQISSGGRTTCGYFYPAGDRILYSSTHHISATCPAPPDRSLGYVWSLEPYDVFTANPDG